MFQQLLFTKTCIYLTVFFSFFSGFDFKRSEDRCKQPKAYAFCGAKTWVGTQWFYDSKRSKCLPYKFCIDSTEKEISENSKENRFEDEAQCESICSEYYFLGFNSEQLHSCCLPVHKDNSLVRVSARKPFSKTTNALSERKRKLYRKLKKMISTNYQSRDGKYEIKQFSQTEVNDPKRCDKPKSYSFCGSRTTPEIHWYYSKKQNRCLPYTYCQTIDANVGMNLENNFFAEQECNKICVRSK